MVSNEDYHSTLSGDRESAPGPGGFPWPVWLPVPILLFLMVILLRADVSSSFSFPYLLGTLNFFCSTVAGVAVAVLVGRTFAEQRNLGLLLVGCGALLWGCASLMTVVTTLLHHETIASDPNLLITIYNLCVFISAWCHLAGLAISLRWNATCRIWQPWTAGAYLGTIALVAAIAATAFAGGFPPFFVQGSGTVVRQLTLITSTIMLAISSLLLVTMPQHRQSPFLRWYAPALLLMACGMFGVTLLSPYDSLLMWTGRLTQCLGGIYLLIAAVVSRNSEAIVPDLHGTCGRRCRYVLAVPLVLTACILRMLLLDLPGDRAVYITFFPAIIFAALYGGRWTGFLTTVLSALLADYFFIPPHFNLIIKLQHDAMTLGIFLFNGLILSWITDAMQAARERAAIAESEAALAAERLAHARDLEEQNALLEQRVVQRTGELELTVTKLEQEIFTRSHVEKELRHSEEVFQLAARLARLGTFDYNPQTGWLECSDIYRQQIGISADAPVDFETVCRAIHPADLQQVLQMVNGVVSGKNDGEFRLDFRMIGLDDGTQRWVSQHGQTFFNASGTAVRLIGVSRDITREREETERRLEAEHALRLETEERLRALEELRSKEQLLIHQSRQAAMGEMIGNIAHQWRQPLNTLGLTVQQLPIFYDLGSFDRKFLTETVEHSMQLILHMSQTIDDFRNYFCPEKEKTFFRIRDSVARTISLISGTLANRNISIEVKAEADPLIHGHPNEFAQALLNIISNARDALVERETVNPRVEVSIDGNDERAVIRIADNAGGIPEEILDRIFDPYFTTKPPQSGTGVGLFMSRSIIETSMGGNLSVRNIDQGAEFVIEV